MDRENVIAKLRAHERELKDAGVLRLSLFGSTARGDGGLGSDIDLLAAFGDPSRLSLLDVVHLENQMTDILGQQDGEMSYAVKYALLRISEATHRLEDIAEELCPGAPWRDIRGLGNHLRHAYDSIDSGLIWMIVEKDVAPLKAAAQAALTTRRERERGGL